MVGSPSGFAQPYSRVSFQISSISREVFRHQHLIVVAAVLLQRLALDSIFHKSQARIKPPCRFVLAHERPVATFPHAPAHNQSQPPPACLPTPAFRALRSNVHPPKVTPCAHPLRPHDPKIPPCPQSPRRETRQSTGHLRTRSEKCSSGSNALGFKRAPKSFRVAAATPPTESRDTRRPPMALTVVSESAELSTLDSYPKF